MTEDVDIERTTGAFADLRHHLPGVCGIRGPTPIEPNAPAFPTAVAMAGDDTPAIGAWMIGKFDPSRSSSVFGDEDGMMAFLS